MKKEEGFVGSRGACSSDRDLWLDVSRLVRRQAKGIVPTGIDRVALAYVQRYHLLAGALVHQGPWSAYLGARDSRALFSKLLRPAASAFVARVQGMLHWAHVPWRSARSPQPSGPGIVLHVTHSDLDDSAYVSSWRRHHLKPVVMVHDLIPITHPELCRKGEAARHVRRMRHTLQGAAAVICNSADTQHELSRFAKTQGLRMPHSLVAPLGTRSLPTLTSDNAAQHASRPVFLMLGTIEPRKNHEMLLRLWPRLVEATGGNAPQLVIVGRRGWRTETVASLLDGDTRLRGHVLERGGCTDAELAYWMSQARALLLPSWTEGFGMPLTEALQQGLPVIASDLPVFREVAGEVPDWAPPADEATWTRLIMAYARPDSAERAAQLHRLRAFTPPTWEAHFDAIDHLIEEVRRRGST